MITITIKEVYYNGGLIYSEGFGLVNIQEKKE